MAGHKAAEAMWDFSQQAGTSKEYNATKIRVKHQREELVFILLVIPLT